MLRGGNADADADAEEEADGDISDDTDGDGDDEEIGILDVESGGVGEFPTISVELDGSGVVVSTGSSGDCEFEGSNKFT